MEGACSKSVPDSACSFTSGRVQLGWGAQISRILIRSREEDLEQMRDTLGEGRRFDECLKRVGYSETNTSQIYLSMQFGSFEKACASIGEFLTRKQKQQKKMQQMMMYPAFLFYVCYRDGALYPNALTRPTVQHGARRTTQAVWLPLLDMAWVSKLTTAGNGIFFSMPWVNSSSIWSAYTCSCTSNCLVFSPSIPAR